MALLSTTVARRRIVYPRPILAMPDILMIDMPAEFRPANARFGQYHPILVETIAEEEELEAYLEEERPVLSLPVLLNARPSSLAADHITIAHYGPPLGGWPYVLLCRWPPSLAAAAPPDLRLFARGAYTIDLYSDREQLERVSDMLLTLLKRRRRVRVEIVPPDWTPGPGIFAH